MKVEIIIPRRAGQDVFYRLLEPIDYLGVHIPAGFTTDGATTPRWLRWILPPVDAYMLAAVIHDWLLATGQGWRAANRKFAEALTDLGIPAYKRFPMIWAVHLNGWFRASGGDTRSGR